MAGCAGSRGHPHLEQAQFRLRYAAGSVACARGCGAGRVAAEGEPAMFAPICHSLRRRAGASLCAARQRLLAFLKPATGTPVGGALGDLARTKAELVAENACLRQQLVVLRRQVQRPALTPADRLRLLLLARLSRGWRTALLIVQPDTPLRWHRQGFRLVWRARSAAAAKRPQVSDETVALIRRLAAENRLWGAERIRGELLKLGIRVGKRTVQRHLRAARPPREPGRGQTWATFVHNHADAIWACDFLQVIDLGFRSLFAFFVVELGSRRVVHVGVTRHPTDAWVAQLLREATPFGAAPRFLIRDNDSKFGAQFAQVAAGSRIAVLRTPVWAPRASAACERFLGSVRRECLDHLLILHAGQLRRALREYCAYYNAARPHQGLKQAIPGAPRPAPRSPWAAPIVSIPILGGLHHDYRRAS
jgi:putative transposase